jgi:hypothetical protein
MYKKEPVVIGVKKDDLPACGSASPAQRAAMRRPAEERHPGSSRTGRTAGLCAPEQLTHCARIQSYSVPDPYLFLTDPDQDLQIRKCELGTDPGDQ